MTGLRRRATIGVWRRAAIGLCRRAAIGLSRRATIGVWRRATIGLWRRVTRPGFHHSLSPSEEKYNKPPKKREAALQASIDNPCVPFSIYLGRLLDTWHSPTAGRRLSSTSSTSEMSVGVSAMVGKQRCSSEGILVTCDESEKQSFNKPLWVVGCEAPLQKCFRKALSSSQVMVFPLPRLIDGFYPYRAGPRGRSA